jgi:hypothetical protein
LFVVLCAEMGGEYVPEKEVFRYCREGGRVTFVFAVSARHVERVFAVTVAAAGDVVTVGNCCVGKVMRLCLCR